MCVCGGERGGEYWLNFNRPDGGYLEPWGCGYFEAWELDPCLTESWGSTLATVSLEDSIEPKRIILKS